MIKGRDQRGKGAPAAADLLVCFPSRAHLSLMPKPICSPARPPEPNKRLHHLKKSRTRGSAGQASPLMWAASRPKSFSGAELLASEPTSPKVTCAGQIKVRHKAKSWQSVMEEIEKLHETNRRRSRTRMKKRPGWAEALGLKRELMQFLTCLRTIRLDFRCFGSFHGGADVTTDDDDEDDDDLEQEDESKADKSFAEEEEADRYRDPAESSRTVFSKWFMVLQEDQIDDHCLNNSDDDRIQTAVADSFGDGEPAVPPPNALLLMRCRSAPAKSWLEEREEEEEEVEKVRKRSLRYLMDEDEKTKESVVVMSYDYNYYHDLCNDNIANETWLVGGIRDSLSRTRSWKR